MNEYRYLLTIQSDEEPTEDELMDITYEISNILDAGEVMIEKGE